MIDLHNNYLYTGALYPKAAGTGNTAYVSEIIDTADMSATECVIITGTNTDADATFTVLIEDGDNSALSDNAAVADANLLGTEALASWTFANDDTVRKIGYIGPKRYVRLTVTPADNAAGNHFVAAVWVQSGRKHQTDQSI